MKVARTKLGNCKMKLIGKNIWNWVDLFWLRVFVNSNKTYHTFNIYFGARRVLKEHWGSLFDLEYWGWHRNFNYPFSAPTLSYIDPRPSILTRDSFLSASWRAPTLPRTHIHRTPSHRDYLDYIDRDELGFGNSFASDIGGLRQRYIQDIILKS